MPPDVAFKVGEKLVQCRKPIPRFFALGVAVIALSGLVVVSEYALAVRDEGEAVLVGVIRSGERLRHEPYDDFREEIIVVCDAIADEE